MAEAHNQSHDSRANRALAELLHDAALLPASGELRQRLDALAASYAALQRRTEALTREHAALRTAVAKASHELKNAVTTVLIIAKRLSDEAEGRLTEDQRALVDTLAAAGRNITSLVEELVVQVRGSTSGTTPVFEEVSIPDVARHLRLAYSVDAQRRGITYRVELLPGTPQAARTDARRLDQILGNLVSNALKFTRRGDVDVRFRRATAADALEVVVSDTGVGIAARHRDTVFEPFRRVEPEQGVQPEGMGLGLAISRDLARQLGGDITLVSEPGKGSIFTLRLPLTPPSAPASDPS